MEQSFPKWVKCPEISLHFPWPLEFQWPHLSASPASFFLSPPSANRTPPMLPRSNSPVFSNTYIFIKLQTNASWVCPLSKRWGSDFCAQLFFTWECFPHRLLHLEIAGNQSSKPKPRLLLVYSLASGRWSLWVWDCSGIWWWNFPFKLKLKRAENDYSGPLF